MEAILLMIMVSANVLCFVIGAKVGQKTVTGEKITLPELNPVSKIQQARSAAKAKAEEAQMSVLLQNVECYNGTPAGQKDVPRG